MKILILQSNFLLFFLIWAINGLFGQVNSDTTVKHKLLYQSAYLEIKEMLEGKKPLSFKRGVFVVENAYLNNSWNYEEFNIRITRIATKLRQLIKDRHLEQFQTAGNWAVFTYMTDSIPQNSNTPFTYDFENFLPKEDPTVGFVTKLLSTNKGNCQSLPFLYKILVEEIGAKAYLAIAPIHCYIKHRDENGKWVNLEMTSGGFARDEWIMQEAGITVEQVKSGIYMDPLSQKESLALLLKELANNYQQQFGVDKTDLDIIETAIKFYPTGATLYMVKYEHFRRALLVADKLKDKNLKQKCYNILHSIDQKLSELNYTEPSKDDYEKWVKANSDLQEKQQSSNNEKKSN